jgi:subtilisin family serine protease
MNPLDLVRLSRLMERTSGRPEVAIALIDGPVAFGHPDLVDATVREIPGKLQGTCSRADAQACTHATFVAGILFARRGSVAPAICPGCTLLLRPIFAEAAAACAPMPSASPEELAQAIVDSVNAGARVINLSSALLQSSYQGEKEIKGALDHAAHRGSITIVAAGNQGTVGSSAITRHSWVIPVASCNFEGRPLSQSNMGKSIGRFGLRAPGESITSLGADGKPRTSGGTSAAAPFVTGTVALLWSEFPGASAARIRWAVTQAVAPRRAAIVPPLLDAWAAHLAMTST